jgi:lipoyl(octanoyl) transferase
MILTQDFGIQPYEPVWQAMKQMTQNRGPDTADELWLLEHTPVYTQGQAGKPEHILKTSEIPIVQSDRGGQVTYHGPGQLVVYVLMDIARRKLGIRTLVKQLETVLIKTLKVYDIDATTQCNAPGVYVNDKKIASIGLRVKQGRTYHGIALNVDMDLSPFKHINPCGFSALDMTKIQDYVPNVTMSDVKQQFIASFMPLFQNQG